MNAAVIVAPTDAQLAYIASLDVEIEGVPF